MNPDPGSLENLRDIAELPPVSWWPLAPGWWVVLMALAAVLIGAAVHAWRSWQANTYRRAATEELSTATSVAEIADILKRCALCAYPRVDVASLSGARWCQWLETTSGTKVPESVQQSLTAGGFSDRSVMDTAPTAAFAAKWIKLHKTPEATSGEAAAKC